MQSVYVVSHIAGLFCDKTVNPVDSVLAILLVCVVGIKHNLEA